MGISSSSISVNNAPASEAKNNLDQRRARDIIFLPIHTHTDSVLNEFSFMKSPLEYELGTHISICLCLNLCDVLLFIKLHSNSLFDGLAPRMLKIVSLRR